MCTQESPNSLQPNTRYKYVALSLLLAQSVGAIIMMRVSRTTAVHPETPYLISSAVVVAEVIKLIGSFVLVASEDNWNFADACKKTYFSVVRKPTETLKVGFPAILYTIQNNLMFVALSNMSAALYQVTYQLKILSTAVLSVIILHKRLTLDQWAALVLLTSGVALIQVPANNDDKTQPYSGHLLLGTAAVLGACVTSAFAGVYLEKMLKKSSTSIWIRNIQLASLGLVVSLIAACTSDYHAIKTNGFLQGYNWATWVAILMQSAGGLIVALVLKFADNILKCFASALAIILSCPTTYFLIGDYTPDFFFVIGTGTVIFATYAYGTQSEFLTRCIYGKKRAKYAQ